MFTFVLYSKIPLPVINGWIQNNQQTISYIPSSAIADFSTGTRIALSTVQYWKIRPYLRGQYGD